LKETKSRLESGVQSAGHQYSNSRMKSRYTPTGQLEETMSGITYLQSVKALLGQAEEDWEGVLARLEKIRDTILDEGTCRDGMVLNLTGDKKVMETIQPSVDSFLKNLPGNGQGKLIDFYKEAHPWVTGLQMSSATDEGFVVPTQVSYVGKGGLLYQPGDKISGSAMVVARFLRTGYLWDHVRVIGGAYGGFCTFSGMDGFFSFLSYRDPNLSQTLDVYDNTASILFKEINQEELEKAIIGTIGDMDGPKSADQKGWISLQRWFKRETAERRQTLRDQVLNTGMEDFAAFGKRLQTMKSSVAVVSSKSAFEAANKDGKAMNIIEVM